MLIVSQLAKFCFLLNSIFVKSTQTVVTIWTTRESNAITASYLIPEKFLVRYENGEEEVLDSKRLEPDGDFIPLEVQSTVCSKVKGGRYWATILEIVESNVRTMGT